VSQYQTELIDRMKTPRMPWHDVAVVIYGESASDLARHFIEYWNHAKIDFEGTKNKQGGILGYTGSIYTKEHPNPQKEFKKADDYLEKNHTLSIIEEER